MRENKFISALFPIGGGTVAGTVEGINQVQQNANEFLTCFSGLDASFFVKVAASAIIGSILGFFVHRTLNWLLPKKK